MELNWQVRPLAGPFHTVIELLAGHVPREAQVAEAFAPQVRHLHTLLRMENIPPNYFADRWFPLILETSNAGAGARELNRRLFGAVANAARETNLRVYWEAFTELGKKLNLTATPSTDPSEPPRANWEECGNALLGEMARLAEPQLMPSGATVVLVPPIFGGLGGVQHVGNMIRLEVLDANAIPLVPQVVQLAWLLAQLNLDVGRYRDLRLPRIERVGALALLPVALAAGASLGLCPCDQATLAWAGEHWKPVLGADFAAVLPQLWDWWAVYQESRPNWGPSLQVLQMMCGWG